MRRITNLTLVAAFLVLIALPLGANLAGVDGGDAAVENRTLAPFPVLERSWASIAAFPLGLDTWFQDHFGFRSRLVEWYGESRYFGLHVSPSPWVILGKAGWLFYGEDGAIEDYTSEQLLSAGEVANWRNEVVRARDWCRARGIAYLFTILPDKHVIYRENFDDNIRPIRQMTRADQIFEATRDTGVVLDVRPALFAAKSEDRLYHVTDTHWNERGAFVAYQQIINELRRQVPAVPPARDRSAFNATTRFLDGRDLAAIMGLKRQLQEEDLRLVPKVPRGYTVIEPAGGYATGGDGRIVTEIPGSTLPRAVIFRDSYVSALAPFLSEHFSRVVYLWQNDFVPQAILDEHPDVVIEEIVGRHLYLFTPSPELIGDQ